MDTDGEELLLGEFDLHKAIGEHCQLAGEALMGDDARREELNKVTARIIGCAYRVSNTLGTGFLEKVYENALAHELRKAGLKVAQQPAIQVWYDGVVVGEFVADLVVEEMVEVELKAVKALDDVHKAQCLNYLRATGLPICLLINFGNPRVQIKRLVQGGITEDCSADEI